MHTKIFCLSLKYTYCQDSCFPDQSCIHESRQSKHMQLCVCVWQFVVRVSYLSECETHITVQEACTCTWTNGNVFRQSQTYHSNFVGGHQSHGHFMRGPLSACLLVCSSVSSFTNPDGLNEFRRIFKPNKNQSIRSWICPGFKSLKTNFCLLIGIIQRGIWKWVERISLVKLSMSNLIHIRAVSLSPSIPYNRVQSGTWFSDAYLINNLSNCQLCDRLSTYMVSFMRSNFGLSSSYRIWCKYLMFTEG